MKPAAARGAACRSGSLKAAQGSSQTVQSGLRWSAAEKRQVGRCRYDRRFIQNAGAGRCTPRTPREAANWRATVYHGLPAGLLALQPNPGAYLAFLGRISPEKRLDRAIEIAKQVDLPLRVAAKVDDVDRDYFESQIKVLLHHPLIDFIGEINEPQK